MTRSSTSVPCCSRLNINAGSWSGTAIRLRRFRPSAVLPTPGRAMIADTSQGEPAEHLRELGIAEREPMVRLACAQQVRVG